MNPQCSSGSLLKKKPAEGTEIIKDHPKPPRTTATAYHRQGNDPQFNLRSELYRIAGVDLTDIPGVSAATAQVILTEIGTDVSRFRNACWRFLDR
ncbi:MAG: hypothetical protein WAM04_05000 [Candidatus Sulfotelmatobacter sp.]